MGKWSWRAALYTGLGQQAVMYDAAAFVRHATGGIMWAARREHLIK